MESMKYISIGVLTFCVIRAFWQLAVITITIGKQDIIQ
ncbi:DUF5516 domain-containing protein [Pectobacterium carotovorum]|nr:hypothetical protein PEC301889_00140 [Pectobacterium carotovorum subsp. carotovorum]